MNSRFSLPHDLLDFLGTENQRWEIGGEYLPYAELYAATEAPEIECTIRGPDGFEGECTAIDLIRDVGPHYGTAVGALIWIPQCSEYGFWNRQQHIVNLYPGVCLDDIVVNPSIYVMGHGTRSRQVFPYFLQPWLREFKDDPRCTALIVCAKTLLPSPQHFPRALKAALLAADAELDVSPEKRKIGNYLAGRCMNEMRGRDDVVELCDTMLQSLRISAELASRLENEAARYACNHGDQTAAIARLERVLADTKYSETHDRFRQILEHIKNAPDDES